MGLSMPDVSLSNETSTDDEMSWKPLEDPHMLGKSVAGLKSASWYLSHSSGEFPVYCMPYCMVNKCRI